MITRTVVRSAFSDTTAVLTSSATSGGKSYATFTGRANGYLGKQYLGVNDATLEQKLDAGNAYTGVSAVNASSATSGGKSYATFTGRTIGSLRRRGFAVEVVAAPITWHVVARPAVLWSAGSLPVTFTVAERPSVRWVGAPIGTATFRVVCAPVVRWKESGAGRHHVICRNVVRWTATVGGFGRWKVIETPTVTWIINPGVSTGECNTADGEVTVPVVSFVRNYVF